jgi:hypothetical protein
VPEVVYELQGVLAEHVPVPPDHEQPLLLVHWVCVSVVQPLGVPAHEPLDHEQPLAERQSMLLITVLHAAGVPAQVPLSYQEHPVPVTQAA